MNSLDLLNELTTKYEDFWTALDHVCELHNLNKADKDLLVEDYDNQGIPTGEDY